MNHTPLLPRQPSWRCMHRIASAAALACLVWVGLGTLAPAAAQAQAQALQAVLPPWLPPAEAVTQVLAQQPQVKAAAAGTALAQARNQRLRAGPHDWVAKAAANQRSERQGARFAEAEMALETAVRWPGKVAVDRKLGEAEVTLGELALADAWHEAARGLLTAWFEALRDVRIAAVLQAQAQIAQRQLLTTERRVRAEEAAQLELLAAQAEAARIEALAARAQGQAQLRLQALRRLYPGLPEPPDAPPSPPAPTEPDTPAVAMWDTAHWSAQILADNHELELAQAKAEQSRLQARRSALEQRADPTVGVRASRERSGQEHVLGVYVSIPLGQAGRRADAQAALAQADMAEQELAHKRARIEAEAWRTAAEVDQARRTRLQLQRAQAKISRSAALQARAYALGESPLADLLLAQRNALEAQLAADGAVLDEMQAHARLLLDSHQLWQAPGAHGH
jgi:outer membrane protein, heavy metal efflux system